MTKPKISVGAIIEEPGSTIKNKTGGWRSFRPVIDQKKCIKCGTCFEACPPKFGAVTKISGEPVPPPVPEEERTVVRKSKKEG